MSSSFLAAVPVRFRTVDLAMEAQAVEACRRYAAHSIAALPEEVDGARM
jgi:hypothetical protein